MIKRILNRLLWPFARLVYLVQSNPARTVIGLTLFVVAGDTLAVRLVYAQKHYGGEAISRVLDQYIALLKNIGSDPERDLSSLMSETRVSST